MAKYVWPVPLYRDGRKPLVTDHYGWSATRGRLHAGSDVMYPRIPSDGGKPNAIDLPFFSRKSFMPENIPALSIASGKVTFASKIGTGIQVNVQHSGGIQSQYFHLRRKSVNKGDLVKQGQPIGEIWHNISGYKLNHLHFQIRKDGETIDPINILSNSSYLKNPWGGIGLFTAIAAGVGAGYLVWRYII